MTKKIEVVKEVTGVIVGSAAAVGPVSLVGAGFDVVCAITPQGKVVKAAYYGVKIAIQVAVALCVMEKAENCVENTIDSVVATKNVISEKRKAKRAKKEAKKNEAEA